jgi:hypothetical protein
VPIHAPVDSRGLAGGGAGFELLGYGLELVAGDADFADEFDGEMLGAGVVELGARD